MAENQESSLCPEKIRAILAAWHITMRECDERIAQLSSITGPVVESPLGDAIYGLMAEYTNTVASQIGWSEDLLIAWWTEHKFGERPLLIGFNADAMMSISTIDELVEFVVEDLDRICLVSALPSAL